MDSSAFGGALSPGFDIGLGGEVRCDLVVPPAPAYISVFGEVRSARGPLPGACVKVLDEHGTPLGHGYSDGTGAYRVTLSARTGTRGFALAGKDGYLTSSCRSVTLDRDSRVDFRLRRIHDPSPGIIGVWVGDLRSRGKLPGACLKLEAAGPHSRVEHALTDEEGWYMFTHLRAGIYLVSADAMGYLPQQARVMVTKRRPLASCAFLLERSQRQDVAAITGLLSDIDGSHQSYRELILIEPRDHGRRPVARTFSNSQGWYLFGGVRPGSYHVQATSRRLPGRASGVPRAEPTKE